MVMAGLRPSVLLRYFCGIEFECSGINLVHNFMTMINGKMIKNVGPPETPRQLVL